MNFLPRAFGVFLIAACAVQAQKSDDPELEDYVPTVEDELVIYVPKNAVRVGFRALSGATAGFGGQGVLASERLLGEQGGVALRGYHDGFVGLDQRTATDPAGVPVPITPDGMTDTWGYQDKEQVVDGGLIAMNAYTATITDTTLHPKNPGTALGVEVTSEREMGQLFGGRVRWGLIAGIGVNQILSETQAKVSANIETITDYYSLEGQAAPDAPYTGPVTSGGVLLRNEVLLRTPPTTSVSLTDVLNRWKLRGAYMTARAGPTVQIPIGTRFSATISAGGVLVYAGTSFEVRQTFTPATGDDIIQNLASSDSAILPGFYVDASMQYDFTDTAGLYLGAVYQSSGNFDHEVASADGLSNYKARVDLGSLQGFRAGMSFKF